MDTASFRMAYSRFEATRGECTRLRSDQGTNFMGAKNAQEAAEMEKATTTAREEWTRQGKEWEVNPPHASHLGGA